MYVIECTYVYIAQLLIELRFFSFQLTRQVVLVAFHQKFINFVLGM